jgi:hypothetical protein
MSVALDEIAPAAPAGRGPLGQRQGLWLLLVIVSAALIAATNFGLFAHRIVLYLDDLPYVLGYHFDAVNHNMLQLMLHDNALYIEQGRFQPAAAMLRYPIIYALFGDWSFGYQLYSNLIALVNSILVGLLGFRLSGSGRLAFTAATLFALYPHNKEGLVQFNSNGGLVEALFFLAAIFSFLRFVRSKRWAWLFLSVCCYAASIWTYEQAYPLFLFFPVLGYCLVGTRWGFKISLLSTIPFVFASLITQALHYVLVKNYSTSLISSLRQIFDHALVAWRIMSSQLLGPGLFDDRVRSWASPAQMSLRPPQVTMILLLAAVLVGCWLWCHRESVAIASLTAPLWRIAIAGLVLDGLGLSFMAVRAGVSPLSRHYYLPAIGLALVHATVLEAVLRRAQRLPVLRSLAVVAVGALIACFATAAAVFNVQRGQAVAEWSDTAVSIQRQLVSQCPSPPPSANIVLLGDTKKATGWLFSDAGVYFPQLWYGRKDVVGKLIDGHSRFVPASDGFFWKELYTPPKLDYRTLVLLQFAEGTVTPIQRLELLDAAGAVTQISLPTTCSGGVTLTIDLDKTPSPEPSGTPA